MNIRPVPDPIAQRQGGEPEVEGVIDAFGVPPVGVVYHHALYPGNVVAVSGVAISFWQYVTGEDTVGALTFIIFTVVVDDAVQPSTEVPVTV